MINLLPHERARYRQRLDWLAENLNRVVLAAEGWRGLPGGNMNEAPDDVETILDTDTKAAFIAAVALFDDQETHDL